MGVSFGAAAVLDGIDLSVRADDIVAVIDEPALIAAVALDALVRRRAVTR